ncbi:MAG: hypothetical protein ACQERJ_02035 [Bacillota bacterium]
MEEEKFSMEELANVEMNQLNEEKLMDIDGGIGLAKGFAMYSVANTATELVTGKSLNSHIHDGVKSIRGRDVEATPMVGFGGATAEEF